jgi:hypothetical protein
MSWLNSLSKRFLFLRKTLLTVSKDTGRFRTLLESSLESFPSFAKIRRLVAEGAVTEASDSLWRLSLVSCWRDGADAEEVNK